MELETEQKVQQLWGKQARRRASHLDSEPDRADDGGGCGCVLPGIQLLGPGIRQIYAALLQSD